MKIFLKIKTKLFLWLLNAIYGEEVQKYVYEKFWFTQFVGDKIMSMREYRKYNKKWLEFMEEHKITYGTPMSMKIASDHQKELIKDLQEQGVKFQ